MTSTRREFLGWSLRAGAAAILTSVPTLDALAEDPPEGKLVGTLQFTGERSGAVGRLEGKGLGGRLAADLSQLTERTLITSNDAFYIRTATPDQIDLSGAWQISLRGLVRKPELVSAARLRKLAKPMGVHLLECSGNSRNRHFGLMSAAKWDGVPVATVLDMVRAKPGATRVLINGFDGHSGNFRGSVKGASWVFTRKQLTDAGAFIATGMNGKPLPRDHGQPVRLVMPGWYGCTCIKWIDRIELVGDDALASGHMREFATRTHQRGIPKRARDYRPAEIDQAAMPVKIEKWRAGGRTTYRVIGIMWGGSSKTDKLMIRFGDDGTYVPVQNYKHETNKTWTLWTHEWRPTRDGKHTIRLKVADKRIRTRRLDSGYYIRTVEIG